MGRTSGSTSSIEPSKDPAGALASLEGRLCVGRVVGAHGLRGQLRLRIDGDAEAWLVRGVTVVLAAAGAEAGRVFEVKAAAPGRRHEWRVTLAGVEDRDGSEALRGREVFIEVSALPALEDGAFYGYQIVGCQLEDEAGNAVGRVTGVWETGADVLVIEGEDGREHLVPAALLRDVDPAAGRAVAEIPAGLLETD